MPSKIKKPKAKKIRIPIPPPDFAFKTKKDYKRKDSKHDIMSGLDDYLKEKKK